MRFRGMRNEERKARCRACAAGRWLCLALGCRWRTALQETVLNMLPAGLLQLTSDQIREPQRTLLALGKPRHGFTTARWTSGRPRTLLLRAAAAHSRRLSTWSRGAGF